MTFLCMIKLKHKTVANTIRWSMVMSVSVKNDCGDRDFATMVM